MSADKDVQNFRANYYHKLGSTSHVEEKKNLLKLIETVPIDSKKLEQYCQHIYIPNDLRCQLWKILLRITPIYRSALDEVNSQREEHFGRLSHVVDVIRAASAPLDAHSDLPLEKLVFMYLLECQVLTTATTNVLDSDTARSFLAIVTAVSRMNYSPCDTYWISRNFHDLIQHKVHPLVQKLTERTHFYLQKEDKSKTLWLHLQNTGLLDLLPLPQWFSSCFADVLPETTFDRIWDKVISGSSMVLVFVAVALLLVLRRPLSVTKNADDLRRLFAEVKPDTGEDAVRKGIELWQRNGGKLTPSSRSSPSSRGTSSTPDQTIASNHTSPAAAD